MKKKSEKRERNESSIEKIQKNTGNYSDRQTDRYTDRQTHTQIDTQSHRQADRQITD